MQRTAIILGFGLFVMSACHHHADDGGGSDEAAEATPEDPCGACPAGGYAVDCGYLWGLGEMNDPICGLDKENAEYLCESTFAGVVLSSPSDNCSFPQAPWDPEIHIAVDTTGVIVISPELLARIEAAPQDIYLDATRLDWDEAGSVVVVVEGELSKALRLMPGDVLLDINGYAIDSMLDTARLYPTLRQADQLVLTLVRDDQKVRQVYEIR